MVTWGALQSTVTGLITMKSVLEGLSSTKVHLGQEPSWKPPGASDAGGPWATL